MELGAVSSLAQQGVGRGRHLAQCGAIILPNCLKLPPSILVIRNPNWSSESEKRY